MTNWLQNDQRPNGAKSLSSRRIRFLAILFCVSVLPLAKGCGHSASFEPNYPNRPIKLVVPFSPGGGTDTFSRIMKRAIEENQLLPQPLVIINLDGAGGTIGSRRVKNARPDGYTILLLHEAIVTAKYSGMASYGPEAFEPIAGTGRMGLVVAVKEDSKYESLTDLLTDAREQPDSLVFAANLGAPVHFVGLRMEQQFPGATFRFTQTGGGTKRLHALKGGHAAVSAFSIEEFLRYRDSGIRALAFCDTQRHPALPDVATTFEQGIPLTHINMQFWWAPKHTPHERLDVFAKALEEAMKTDIVREKMAAIHSDPVFVDRDEMRTEVENRQREISKVDLRQSIPLPNIPLVVSLVTLAFAGIALRGSRSRTRQTKEISAANSKPRKRIDLASLTAATTLLYAVALTIEIVDFRLATFAYVAFVGEILANDKRRQLPIVLAIATGASLGLHLVLTVLFDLILP